MGQENCRRDTPLSLGGPCEGPLMALHTNATIAEVEVLPGLYFTASSEQLRTLICDDNAERLRVSFLGMPDGARGSWKWNCKPGPGAPSRPAYAMCSPYSRNCGNARSARRPAGKSSRRCASRTCRSIPHGIDPRRSRHSLNFVSSAAWPRQRQPCRPRSTAVRCCIPTEPPRTCCSAPAHTPRRKWRAKPDSPRHGKDAWP